MREMLLQHILTEDIFLSIFSNVQFHRENNVARQLDGLARTFFTGSVRQDAMDRLRVYYGAIGKAAYDIADYAEKQQFLKAVYEDFYQAYNPAAADRLGVVYTPNEVVDFIIRGTDWLLQKHFGKTYRNEIYANEVAILPYYIANLNIEYTYRERTGRYLEFPNLSFVDTLDNMDWQGAGASGGAVERQAAFNLGGMSEENWIRVQEQNEQAISVIIGNPPYNANQQNENDNNKNREYPAIDRRISETYIAASTAQKTKQYDMYKRFIRWASDRLADDGIVGFITNRAYLETRQDDGFRQIAGQEFTDIYIVDLGSDVRRNPKISGTTHNVFGIQTGVAIGFFVREKARLGTCGIHYVRREDAELAVDKLAYLSAAAIPEIEFDAITPNTKSYWLDQSDSDFEELLPLANRETKLAKTVADEQAVFGLYSLGVITARDEWVYDFDAEPLGTKVRAFINEYEENRAVHGGRQVDDAVLGTIIKWTRDLKRQLRLDTPNIYERQNVRRALFRPFVFKDVYFSQNLNEMQYQLPEIFRSGKNDENKVLCFCVNGKAFYVLAADRTVDYHLTGDSQCLPLYRYTADGERVSNITEWGLRQFREHYGDDNIGAEDVFAYVYAMLHDPAYRERYEVDLRREFPRVYFQDDFAWWAGKGRELLDLHIGFESVTPWGLERVEAGAGTGAATGSGRADGAGTGASTSSGRAARVILRADRDVGVIRLDGETSLRGVPAEAWEYRLGSRSALEWVLDQYKEKKPRDPTIRERFNTYRFAEHKERVVELLDRVCAVSVATVGIVGELEERSGVERGGGDKLVTEY